MVGGVRSGGDAAYPGLAQPYGSSRDPAQTLSAAGSSCQRFLLRTPQPSPSRQGGPFRGPSAPVRKCASGAGLAGLYLAPGQLTVGARAKEPRAGLEGTG